MASRGIMIIKHNAVLIHGMPGISIYIGDDHGEYTPGNTFRHPSLL